MSNVLNKKIDFAVIFSVKKANPNGDPLNGNMPRTNYDGLGEVSDVCLKRKIRNRLQDMGEKIYVQSDDRTDDGFKSLLERADSIDALVKAKKENDSETFAREACAQWADVRAFGQVFAFKGDKLSVGVRGPVTVQTAESVNVITASSMQITKSVNSIPGPSKSSDTMGTKYRVDFGLYRFFGSINVQLAEKTGFTYEDAVKIKEALKTLFENDCSSARPDGSMNVEKVIWWEHNCKAGQYPSAVVHRSVKIKPNTDNPHSVEDYSITVDNLEGLAREEYNGI